MAEGDNWADCRPLIAHSECMVRSVLGGIGHVIAHEWWCGTKDDPDAGLTFRQSALLVDAWVRIVGADNLKMVPSREGR